LNHFLSRRHPAGVWFHQIAFLTKKLNALWREAVTFFSWGVGDLPFPGKLLPE
jgi:hypothetical protein